MTNFQHTAKILRKLSYKCVQVRNIVSIKMLCTIITLLSKVYFSLPLLVSSFDRSCMNSRPQAFVISRVHSAVPQMLSADACLII